MDGQAATEPLPGAKRFLSWLDHPAAGWTTLCGVLLVLTLFGVTDILLSHGSPVATRRILAMSNVLAHLSYAALAPVLLHVLGRHPLRRGSVARALSWHLATAFALGGAAVLVMQLGLHYTLRPLASVEAVLLRAVRSLRYNLHDILFIYVLLAGSAMAVGLFRRERQRGLAAVALGRELTAAHLESLRVRVDPHFLFNTLNALLPLVATRPDAACDAVVRLGTLLRLGFRSGASGLVPIRDEAEYLRCFLVLEEMRVSDRLSVLVDFAPEVLDAAIPALVLKPFVENALAAGVFRSPGPALLEVVARREGGEVVVRVRSEVRGDPDPDPAPAEVPATAAARERLARTFGALASVRVAWTGPGTLDAVVRLPFTPFGAILPVRPGPPAPERLPAAPSPGPDGPVRALPLLDRPSLLAALAGGLWLAVGLYYGSQAHLRAGTGPSPATVPVLAYYVPPLVRSCAWALLTPAILLFYRRRPLYRTPAMALLAHVLVAAAASCLVVVLAQPVLSRVRFEGAAPTPSLAARLSHELPGEAGTYLLLASVLLVLDAARRARASELRSARLEAHLAEARLAALRTQLHPHFLFNTLNGILPLIQLDPDAAARVLVRLGDLLRAGLASDATHVVPLADEVDFLRRYLEIETIRFGDRLTVTFDVSGDALDAAVPRFVLQPLVENAVKHGVSRCPGPGTLTVSARRDGETLAVEVRNEAPGADLGPLPPSDGVGLSNARTRLAQLFGDEASLETAPFGEHGFRSRLVVPFSGRNAPRDATNRGR